MRQYNVRQSPYAPVKRVLGISNTVGEAASNGYCYNVSKKSFVELDKPSVEHMETYCDFDTMLESAFSAVLS